MQAMACELPVVTTPVGAIPELARDGDTALLVPPEDPVALAGAIARLLSDTGLAQRLAHAGRKEVTSRYTATAMLDAMEEVIWKAASERR
jgi:glycosyltransferase involved in cell wall biosynthesis